MTVEQLGQPQESSNNNAADNLTPTEDLVQRVSDDEIDLIVCSEAPIIDTTIALLIRSLSQKNQRPLVLAIESSGNPISHDHTGALRHVGGVDQVVKVGKHSTENALLRFNSHVFRITEAKHNARLRYRMNRPISPHDLPYAESHIVEDKYVPQEQLRPLIESYQRDGKRIVIVAGVFDVLHEGHVDFLAKAKELGDILIVLTNSDASATKQPKNVTNDRPINPLNERVQVLSCMKSVDHVSAFDTPDITNILKELHDIRYVKTEKDTAKTVRKEMKIVEQAGGSVFVFPAITGHTSLHHLSSTHIIHSHRLRGFAHPERIIPTADLHANIRSIARDYFDVRYQPGPPEYSNIIDDMFVTLVRLNTKTGILTGLKHRFENMPSDSLSRRTELVSAMANHLYAVLSAEVFTGIEGKPVYKSLLLSLALDFIGIDSDVLPVQYVESDTNFGHVVGLKLSDGTMIFIDPLKNRVHEPIVFEDYYFKVLPQHTSFQLHRGKEYFARRIYFETEKQRVSAIAMNCLYEVLGTSPEAQIEIRHLFGDVFTDFHTVGVRSLKHHKHPYNEGGEIQPMRYPKIVAHGGITSLNLSIEWAENSDQAITKAVNKGVDVLEIDVVPTKDGKWIASHFVDLSKISDAKGTTLQYTLGELKQIHFQDANGEALTSTFLGLQEVLHIAGTSGVPIKVDIKVKDIRKTNLPELVNQLRESHIPPENIIITCGDGTITSELHRIAPELPLELNTVEATNYLLSNGLMKNPQMVDLFLDYIIQNAHNINAHVVSLMQVALNTWGDAVFQKLVDGIHAYGFETQIWVATTIDEYEKDARMGTDSVLMHNEDLIEKCMQLRKNA